MMQEESARPDALVKDDYDDDRDRVKSWWERDRKTERP